MTDPRVLAELERLRLLLELGEVRFELGEIVVTPSIDQQLSTPRLYNTLARHQCGHWGLLSEADMKIQNRELENKTASYLMSTWPLEDTGTYWIISEFTGADGWVTTVLLPEER